ncbi:MAG: hypothetical protein AB7F86_05270 [Bdellovibrionales bacterium]
MKNMKVTRRQAIKGFVQASAALAAADTVIASLVSSQSRLAYAQANDFSSFFHLGLPGAPPRWMFDLFLNPTNEASRFVASPMLATRYASVASGPYIAGQFQQVRHAASGLYVPRLWSLSVPRPGGGLRPASELLSRLLSIRGIDSLSAAHGGAQEFHQVAVTGSISLSSVTADRAPRSKENPALNLLRATWLNPGPNALFRSSKGYSSFRHDIRSGASNELSAMFSGVRPVGPESGFTNQFINNLGQLKSLISNAFAAQSPSTSIYHKSLLDNSDSALKILTDSAVTTFSALSSDWSQLYDKYDNLIKTTLQQTYPGLNDKPVGRTATTDEERQTYQFGNGIYAQTLNAEGTAVDLRRMLGDVDSSRLAAQFAVMEFMVKNGICPSINVNLAPFDNIRVNNSLVPMPFDQHFVGVMPGVLLNSMYYLSLTACLLALMDAMGTKLNDSLIYLGSEFNRSARINGSGSDHGAQAASVSLLSGRQSGFKLVGNILKDSAGEGSPYASGYKGTWGFGAPVGGEALSIVQVWGSVLHLLGVPLSEIPNAVNKERLLFSSSGSLALKSPFDAAPINVVNASKT